jgi:enoyl-CoA hydratase
MTTVDNATGTEPAVLAQVLRGDPEPGSVTDHVALERVGSVAVVTLARPEQYNALSLASWRRLGVIFTDLGAEGELRAVVVRGAGDRAFGAGADIKEFPQVRLSAEDALVYNESIAAALTAVTSLAVPVVAMVQGLAVGGGCELAAACDVRLASQQARFGIPIGRLGVTLGYTEADALVRLIGPAALKYLLFSGRLVDADEALRMGLVQRVVATEDLVDETVDLLGAVLASAPVTMRAAKLVADMCGRPLNAQDTEALTRATVEAYGGADLREGVAAFLEGRTPVFPSNERKSHVRP